MNALAAVSVALFLSAALVYAVLLVRFYLLHVRPAWRRRRQDRQINAWLARRLDRECRQRL